MLSRPILAAIVIVGVILLMSWALTPGAVEPPPRVLRSPVRPPASSLSRQILSVYFELDEKGLLVLPDHIQSVIVDIGAHDGGEAVDFAKNNPATYVLALEPLAQMRKGLVAATAGYKNVKAMMVAAGPQSTITKIYVAKDATSSGLLPFNKSAADAWLAMRQFPSDGFDTAPDLVVVLAINDLLDAIPPHLPIKYYWSDAQGYDFTILKAIRPDLLKRIRKGRLEVQFRELYEGDEGTPEGVRQYLEAQGFTVTDLGTGVKDMWTDLQFSQ